ncbi:MAG: hypothetical protein ACTHJL_11475 [Amnibacterium sp.]
MIVLAVILACEAAGLLLVTVLLLVDTLASGGGSTAVASGIALAVTAAVLAVGLAFAARGVLRAAKWTRPAGVVWQLVQIFVGLDATQGAGARYDLAALLVIPAVVALVLFFTPSVTAAMRRR